MIAWQRLKASLAHIAGADVCGACCIGFDGYVDTLYRVVQSRDSLHAFQPFTSIADFASRAAAAAGRSADMEIIPLDRRMGGNAPLLAQALAQIGFPTHCLGAMGQPERDDVFLRDDILFKATSIAECAQTIAFEFDDGKLMFGDVSPLQRIGWKEIKEAVGLDAFIDLFRGASLWGTVNWSFVLRCNEILAGMIEEVLPACSAAELAKKILFFDLADPSGRSPDDILVLCEHLRSLGGRTRVALGLNENESLKLASVLRLEADARDMAAVSVRLRESLAIEMAVIHGQDYAVAATDGGTYRAKGLYIAAPQITTGGGDHFNAGLCAGLLTGLAPEDALAVGNLVSSCYVTCGKSPTLEQLADYADRMAQHEEVRDT